MRMPPRGRRVCKPSSCSRAMAGSQARSPARAYGCSGGGTSSTLRRSIRAPSRSSSHPGARALRLPVYESLARGTPAIITDLPVFGPALSPGVVRVRVDDEPALADAMLGLASDADLRVRLGAGGRAAVSGLTWEQAARTTREVFAQTLGR